MSSETGKCINISVFGESHGHAIGVVINGLCAGEQIDCDKIAAQMARRAPGKDKSATPRVEADTPKIISGVLDGFTTGAPLCAVIENTNTRSADYSYLNDLPRPSHADYPAKIKYDGHFDIRGSGHFSGRLTAPITFAGAVCRQMLERRGITVGGHIYSIGKVNDTPFNPTDVDKVLLDSLNCRAFSVIDKAAQDQMRDEIEAARLDGDSIGGVLEIAVSGLPVGIGEPMFRSVESVLSSLVFSIPAVKGVEFGAGFSISQMRGSEANDRYINCDDKVCTLTNNNGGIVGGLTTAMPLIMRVAIKPTPSISCAQTTLNTATMQTETLTIRGRHDPCIAPRALPAIEAAVCIGLCDLMKEGGML